MKKHRSFAALALIAAVMTACASLGERSPPNVSLTGVWRIDPEVSGDPANLPGITGAPDKAGKARSSDGDGAKVLAEIRSRELRIDQMHGSTKITYDNGATERFDWSVFGHGAVASGWRKTHFIIRRPGPGGHELIRRYMLSDAGKSLTVVTVFNKMALTQFYNLDKQATAKAFGKVEGEQASNP